MDSGAQRQSVLNGAVQVFFALDTQATGQLLSYALLGCSVENRPERADPVQGEKMFGINVKSRGLVVSVGGAASLIIGTVSTLAHAALTATTVGFVEYGANTL